MVPSPFGSGASRLRSEPAPDPIRGANGRGRLNFDANQEGRVIQTIPGVLPVIRGDPFVTAASYLPQRNDFKHRLIVLRFNTGAMPKVLQAPEIRYHKAIRCTCLTIELKRSCHHGKTLPVAFLSFTQADVGVKGTAFG